MLDFFEAQEKFFPETVNEEKKDDERMFDSENNDDKEAETVTSDLIKKLENRLAESEAKNKALEEKVNSLSEKEDNAENDS